MNIRIFLLLLIFLITSVHAQELINEDQILLSGYVDNSGKVLLTGYVTPESLNYMYFLNDTQYTFDNNTSQLYAVTDELTSKSGDIWMLNFSLEGYYSDYAITFDLPQGAQITGFEIPPELHYEFLVKQESLTVSIQGYRVISPRIKIDYRLSANESGQSIGQTDLTLTAVLLGILAVMAVLIFYRRRKKGATKEVSESREKDLISEPLHEIKPIIEEIRITGEMQKVIDTLSDKEKAIMTLLIKRGGSATQADIRFDIGIPKSSLSGIINTLKRKNLIKKHECGRTNVIELSEWFLSNNEPK